LITNRPAHIYQRNQIKWVCYCRLSSQYYNEIHFPRMQANACCPMLQWPVKCCCTWTLGISSLTWGSPYFSIDSGTLWLYHRRRMVTHFIGQVANQLPSLTTNHSIPPNLSHEISLRSICLGHPQGARTAYMDHSYCDEGFRTENRQCCSLG